MPLVAASSLYVCVADNEAVDVYAVATLKLMFRSVPTDAFVVHMFIRNHTLHVVDVAGNYGAVDLRANTPRPARSLTAALAPPAPSADEPKAITSTRGRNPGKLGVSAANASVLRAGHFFAYHTAEDGTAANSELWIALLLNNGDVQIHPARPGSSNPAATIGQLPYASADSIFTVGLETGVICAAVHGDHFVRLFVPTSPCTYAAAATVYDARVDVTALAAHPTGYALAVGGRRGELTVLQDVGAPADGGFSDHWHHTPVAALLFTNGGNALLSGAAEGTVCLWSLADFSMIKTRTPLESVHALVSASDLPSLVAIPGGAGGLALLDLVERRIVRRRDSVHWSSTHPCRGVVVADWFGTKAAILTGLPDVIKVYDPVGHDPLHTLVVTPAMETIAKPPTVGVTHVCCTKGGKLMVTFEDASDLAMPSVLRWWRWDGREKKYTEEQCVYAPHGTEPLIALAALSDRSIVTVSATSAKCWAPLTLASDAAVAAAVADLRKLKMHCASSIKPTPGRRFTAFTLSSDASVAFLAQEDTVHAYAVVDAAVEAQPWPKVLELTQNVTVAAFHSLVLVGATAVVAATKSEVLVLPFDGQSRVLNLPDAAKGEPVQVNALCSTPTQQGFAVAATIKSKTSLFVFESESNTQPSTSVVIAAADVVAVQAFGQFSYVVVSKDRGLKLVSAQHHHVASTTTAAGDDSVSDAPSNAQAPTRDVAAASTPAPVPSVKSLAAFFKRPAPSTDADDSASIAAHQRLIAAREYMHLAVGQGEAYAAPPANQLLDGFLAALLAHPVTAGGLG